jgi:hypothetical protein
MSDKVLAMVRLSRVLGDGVIELETEDAGVKHRAIESHLNDVPETFQYWAGELEDVVVGRVTSIRPDCVPITFSVLTTESVIAVSLAPDASIDSKSVAIKIR